MRRRDDLRAALEFAAAAAAVSEPADLHNSLLPALCRLVGSPAAVLHEFDFAEGSEHSVYWPTEVAVLSALEAYIPVQRQHPFLLLPLSALNLSALRVSDLLAPRQWRSTGIYLDSHRHLCAEDQMMTGLRQRGACAEAVSVLTDHPPFTDRQRDLLRAARPHLAAAVRRTHHPGAMHDVISMAGTVRRVSVPCSTPHATTAACQSSLTPAEFRVMALLATGQTSRAAAHRIGVSPRTVDKHLENVYRKLGVAGRLEALLALGLLPVVHVAQEASLPGCRLSARRSFSPISGGGSSAGLGTS
jgi:DNA-binding CsgD family transcriptional regulator